MKFLLSAAVLALGLSFTGSAVLAAGTMGKAYGARTTPHPQIVNPADPLACAGPIDSKPTAKPADIATAIQHVKMALGETLASQAVSTAQTRPCGCSVKYAGR